MRHITALPPEKLLRDDEFNFKRRSNALVDRWHQILNTNKFGGDASDVPANVDTRDEDARHVNGQPPVVAADAGHPHEETAATEKPDATAPMQE